MTVQMSAIIWGPAKDDLSMQQTKVLSTVIEKQATQSVVVEHVMVWQASTVPLFLEEDANDASMLQTVPLPVVKRQRAAMRIRTFFVTIAILFVSILLLGALAAIIVVVPSPAYKAEVLIIFLIALSYVTSVQMKCIDRARQQVYLTVTQFARTEKKRSVSAQSKDEDMKHLKLIKQDTTGYLRALAMRDLKKGS